MKHELSEFVDASNVSLAVVCWLKLDVKIESVDINMSAIETGSPSIQWTRVSGVHPGLLIGPVCSPQEFRERFTIRLTSERIRGIGSTICWRDPRPSKRENNFLSEILTDCNSLSDPGASCREAVIRSIVDSIIARSIVVWISS